jgi:hypothetical protein
MAVESFHSTVPFPLVFFPKNQIYKIKSITFSSTQKLGYWVTSSKLQEKVLQFLFNKLEIT